jgi:hypothetical protein
VTVATIAPQGNSAIASTLTPSIASELDDYAPGSLVLLEGVGWQPAEWVHIIVNDDLGEIWRFETDVLANDAGVVLVDVQLPNTFVANYVVQASGTSGSIASSTFTDAASKIAQSPITITAPVPTSPATSFPVFTTGLQITYTGGSGTGVAAYSVSAASDACKINSTDSTKLDIIHGQGTCVVKVTKPSDATYLAANATLSVPINRIAQASLAVSGPTDGAFGQSIPITYTGGSGTGAVTYSVSAASDACKINDIDPAKLDILHGLGTCSVKVAKANDSDYLATNGSLSVNTRRSNQSSLQISGPTSGSYGQSLPITYTGGSGPG